MVSALVGALFGEVDILPMRPMMLQSNVEESTS